eukprot:3381874-Alexandrium_andersonii.AAC.1
MCIRDSDNPYVTVRDASTHTCLSRVHCMRADSGIMVDRQVPLAANSRKASTQMLPFIRRYFAPGALRGPSGSA